MVFEIVINCGVIIALGCWCCRFSCDYFFFFWHLKHMLLMSKMCFFKCAGVTDKAYFLGGGFKAWIYKSKKNCSKYEKFGFLLSTFDVTCGMFCVILYAKSWEN